MKRDLLVAALALLLAACGNSPTEPLTGLPGPSLKADVVTILKGKFPIGPGSSFNPCTGEFVDFVGEFNLVVRQITSDSGHVTLMIHSVAGHVSGMGRTTGTEYLSNEHFNFVQHFGGDATNLIIEFTITPVSKGSLPNQGVGKLQVFVVVNANGDVTVDRVVETGFGECQA